VRRGIALAGLLAVAAVGARGEGTLRHPSVGQSTTFDAKSYVIGGKRVLLRSAGVPYFRIPPEEWRERLFQTRLAGFNMVETPVPWDLHQPQRDTFRFEGQADLARFLDLCHEMHLFAFVRIGPYVNAAITNGGLPQWLADDPRILIRSSDVRFIEAVKAWWAKLLPVVAARQVPKGAVALVQVENNYEGTQPGYLGKLCDEAQELGITVPIARSTVNPCKRFDGFPGADQGMFVTTEWMPASPLPWGEARRPMVHYDTILLEGLAKGLGIYNHSTWAAGTNYAVLPACSMPTRFEDASSGVLEGGGLSPIAAEARRVNLFARSFETLLTDAVALKTHPLLDQARRGGAVAYGRTNGQASLLFLRHRAGPATLALTDAATGQSLRLPVDEATFRHVVLNHRITPKTTLAFSTAQVLAIEKLAGKQLFCVYAPIGAEAVMVFRTAAAPKLRTQGDALTWDEAKKQLVLRWRCADKGARADFLFDVAGSAGASPSQADTPIHVVAIEEGLVPRTYVVPDLGLLVGVPGLGESAKGGGAGIELRFPPVRSKYPIALYPDGDKHEIAAAKGPLGKATYDDAAGRLDALVQLEATPPTPVLLRRWEAAAAAAEAAPAFDDSSWLEASPPKPLGDAPYGWYRCHIQAPRAISRKLLFENVADAVTVFLNGRYVGQSGTKPLADAPRDFLHSATFDLSLAAGDNVLAVLAKNWGQYRCTASYAIPLAKGNAWGILGNVLLDNKPLTRWRQREGLSPDTPRPAWGTAPPAECPLRWYRASFKLPKDQARLVPRAVLKGMGYGALWLNGRFAGLYQQRAYDAGHGYALFRPWLRDENELVLLEEDGKQPTEAEIQFERDASIIPVPLELK